jgi:regulator of sigma E protease
MVGEVSKDSPAEKAGIQKDDKIIGLNGESVPYFQNFKRKLEQLKGQEISVTVLRKETDTLNFKLTTTEDGRIGYAPYGPDKFFELKAQKYSFAAAIPAGVAKGWGFITDQIKALGKIFSGKIKASESLGGFGTFAKLFPTSWDWRAFWNITAIISLILAIMNLLPVPALDGGHVMFLLWEMITGRKPNDRVVEIATTAGFILILALIVYVNGLDIMRGCK